MADRSPTSSLGFRPPERPSSVITTFYSFKGGVGRTQSLFNVAARLAAARRNAMMVDVDLEAPGLSLGVLDERQRKSKEGFAEIANGLLADLRIAFEESKDVGYLKAMRSRYRARVRRALHEVKLPIPPKNEDLEGRLRSELNVTLPDRGSLYLLSTGRIGDHYPHQVAQLPLTEAYTDRLDAASLAVAQSLAETFEAPVDPDGLVTRGHLFAALMREIFHIVKLPRQEETFDHVLVDSRSGLADVGGLCLLGLAETRVVLTGLNEQNVTGTKMVLDDVSQMSEEARDDDHLIVVFSPVPEGELDLLARRLEEAKEMLGVSDEQVRLLHYHPRIALEEKAFAKPFHEYTRIYQEYEDLTDRLLHLTGNDARTLVSHALTQFQEAGESEDRYRDLVYDLIPAAFLDEDQVASVVDGLCAQLSQERPDETALALFTLWVALFPTEVRVIGPMTIYVAKLANIVSEPELQRELHLRSVRKCKNAMHLKVEEYEDLYNWAIDLGRLAHLVRDRDPKIAKSFYRHAIQRFERAVDMDSRDDEAWYNWGVNLGRLAYIVQDEDLSSSEILYEQAFSKFESAVEIDTDKHEAWGSWGTNLGHLAHAMKEDEPDRAESLLVDSFDKFRQAVAAHPSDDRAWYNWGVNLETRAYLAQDAKLELGFLQEACEKFQSAVEARPEKCEAWLSWGGNLLRQNRLSVTVDQDGSELLTESAEKLRTAVKCAYNTPASLFWLTVVLAEKGLDHDIREAQKYLQTLLDMEPLGADRPIPNLFEDQHDENVAIILDHPQLHSIIKKYNKQIKNKNTRNN